jgi:hypothetical protein
MNLLFHEKIKKEIYKDRLEEASHWRLVKQIKQNQKEQEQPHLRYGFFQILEAGRVWLSEVALIRQSSKEKTF